MLAFNGIYPPIAEYGPKFLPVWDSEYTDPHYPVGWAWALDTPFKWTKQVASYFGGTRNGMIVSWPGHTGDAGGIRTQFHHVIDVVPTILEAAGIVQPEMVDGVKQKPIEGFSFAYTFDKAGAAEPSTHHTSTLKCSERPESTATGGSRRESHTQFRGYCSSTNRSKTFGKPRNGISITSRPTTIWTEFTDVQDKYPDKLKQLQQLFVAEGEKYNAFVYDGGGVVRVVSER